MFNALLKGGMPAGAALPARLQTQLMSLLSTDPVKGAAMLKDLPVLAGGAGLGEAMASPSCCWAYLDLHGCLTKLESWERMSKELREALVKAKAEEREMGSQRECSSNAILAGGVNVGGFEQPTADYSKVRTVGQENKTFCAFLHECLTANKSYLPVASVSHSTKQLEPSFMVLETNGFTSGNALPGPSVLMSGGCVLTRAGFRVYGVASGGRNEAVCLPMCAFCPWLVAEFVRWLMCKEQISVPISGWGANLAN